MKKNGIFWRFFRAYAIVLLLSLATAFFLLRPILFAFLSETESARLAQSAQACGKLLETSLTGLTMAEGNLADSRLLSREVEKVSQELGLHVLLFSPQGVELAKSQRVPARFLTNAAPMIEQLVQLQANPTSIFKNIIVSATNDLAAVPVHGSEANSGETINFILLVGISKSTAASTQITRLWLNTLIAFITALIVGCISAYAFSVSFGRPLEVIQAYAERFGQGDFRRKVPSPPSLELSVLSKSLNTMAAQLDSRISEITRQRNEQQAILQSMREGVIALDLNERILSLNHRAEQFLGVHALEVRGTLLQEYLRHVDLQRFVATTLQGNYTLDEELPTQLRFGKDRLFEARSAPLRDANENDIGVIIILNDVTLLNRLENIRRDFVANVSHELRTPITSILGFTETLLDGALEEPEQARRFLQVIERQSNRLTQVIDDLLNLSRLEKKDDLRREPVMLSVLLNEGIEVIAPEAQANGTELIVECPTDAELMLNPTLMTQALSNLIGNAVRYAGGEGKRVWVRGSIAEERLTITVQDEGPGIATDHLPRLFERFYRVDKARSRDLGGTGLGLSIVQHVAQVHQGEVRVESVVEKGTKFTIELPLS